MATIVYLSTFLVIFCIYAKFLGHMLGELGLTMINVLEGSGEAKTHSEKPSESLISAYWLDIKGRMSGR